MKTINIGLIGSGFAAELHCHSYKKLNGIHVRIKAVASTNKHVNDFAEKFQIQDIYTDYKKMLEDEEIDIIDICTPPNRHGEMVIDVIKAGKNVICEKPFTGYFGNEGDLEPIGKSTSKEHMYQRVLEDMDQTREIIEKSGKLFMYAENWIYSPTILKSAEIIRTKKSKILFMKGEESHSGSHAPHAAQWSITGGGALIRMGCHPLSAILYLKRVEAQVRGENIRVESIMADTGVITDHLNEEERKYIAARPVDVDDWASVMITFSDGTKANVIAGDMIVGGVKNYIELYNNDSALICNITPNDNMLSYFVDKKNIEDLYITEKVETKEGWQFVCTSEELVRGYIGELQDFVECVVYGRKPLSDFGIAYDTIKAIYAAYVSASEGRRVTL